MQAAASRAVEQADEVCRQSILREKVTGSHAPLHAPRDREVAREVALVCRYGQWDQLPTELWHLERIRNALDGYAKGSGEGYRQGCKAISNALGELREAAMAEMSRDLCQ